MSILASDLAEALGFTTDDDERSEVALGTALRGRFAELDIDSVEAVRDLREPR